MRPRLWWAALAGVLLAAAAEEVVASQRFQEGGRFFYLVSGFGLARPGDYTSAVVPNACTCRRRCQVALNCRSVTIVPLNDGVGGVECRVSPHPTDPAHVDLRPRLGRMPGALHILETVALQWQDAEADGLIYSLSKSPDTYFETGGACKAGEAAVATTWLQFDIFKKYLDKLPDGSGMVVELCRACLSDPARPLTWGYNKQILYSDTELDASLLVHGPPGLTAYHVAKVDSEYKLVGTDGTAKWPILCQDNDLNLDL